MPLERMAGQLSRRRASWRERELGSWLVLLDGGPVAFVEVTPIGEGSGVDPDALEAGAAAARDLFERLGHERVYAEVDHDNEKSLRVLAKAPGVRRIDGELYELTARAFLEPPGNSGAGQPSGDVRSRP